MVFLKLRREPGVHSRVMAGVAINNFSFFQRRQDSSLVQMDTSGVETRLGRTIWTLLEVRQETEVHFLFGTAILGFFSIFQKGQVSSPYEALNSVCLSRGQSDVKRPVQMSWTPTAFSRVSTGDSDIPSSFEMKDEPQFKLLQGNRSFF